MFLDMSRGKCGGLFSLAGSPSGAQYSDPENASELFARLNYPLWMVSEMNMRPQRSASWDSIAKYCTQETWERETRLLILCSERETHIKIMRARSNQSKSENQNIAPAHAILSVHTISSFPAFTLRT